MTHTRLADFAQDNSPFPPPARLVELIPCAALLYTRDGTIVAAKRLFSELLGYAPDELRARRIADLIAWQDRGSDEAIHTAGCAIAPANTTGSWGARCRCATGTAPSPAGWVSRRRVLPRAPR